MEKPCSYPQHKGNLIEKVCFNDTCQSCRLLCHQCLKENKHCGHNHELKKLDELTLYIEDISKQCDEFIMELQNLMTTSSDLMNKLKIGIRTKYQCNKEKINSLKAEQISQALSCMFKFNQVRSQVKSELVVGYNYLDKIIESCFQDLELISDEDLKQAKELIKKSSTLYWNEKKKQEAIEFINQSINLNPYDPEALCKKGEFLRYMDQGNDARIWFGKALEIDQQHVESLYYTGWYLYQANKYNEAITYFDRALARDSNHLECLSQKGECLRKMEQYNEALIWLDKALLIEPNDYNQQRSKGQCLKELKQYQQALIWFDKALLINPTNKSSLDGKSKYFAQLEFCQEKLGLK